MERHSISHKANFEFSLRAMPWIWWLLFAFSGSSIQSISLPLKQRASWAIGFASRILKSPTTPDRKKQMIPFLHFIIRKCFPGELFIFPYSPSFASWFKFTWVSKQAILSLWQSEWVNLFPCSRIQQVGKTFRFGILSCLLPAHNVLVMHWCQSIYHDFCPPFSRQFLNALVEWNEMKKAWPSRILY